MSTVCAQSGRRARMGRKPAKGRARFSCSVAVKLVHALGSGIGAVFVVGFEYQQVAASVARHRVDRRCPAAERQRVERRERGVDSCSEF